MGKPRVQPWVCVGALGMLIAFGPFGAGVPYTLFPPGFTRQIASQSKGDSPSGSLDVFFPCGQKPNPPFWVTLTGNSVDDNQITGVPLVSGVFLTFGLAGDILFTDTPSVFVRDFGNIGPPALVHRFSKVWFLEAFGLKMPDQDTSSRATKVRLLS